MLVVNIVDYFHCNVVISLDLGPVHTSHFCRVEFNSIKCGRNATADSDVEFPPKLILPCMSVSGKMLQRLRNYLIWRTKILNGGFLVCKKLLKEGEEGG